MGLKSFAAISMMAVVSGIAFAAGGGSYVVSVGSTTAYIEPTQDLPNSGTPLGWTARTYNLAQDNGKGDTGNGDGSGNWQSNGRIGLGYGDGDDVTAIDNDGSVRSVYSRTTFNVASASAIVSMILEIDYDDAYVAWLNGTEISRANISTATPLWNSAATAGHEATHKYTTINVSSFTSALVTGDNVLAVAVWNDTATSSDMTVRPRLSLYTSTYVAPPLHTYLTWQNDTGTTMTGELPHGCDGGHEHCVLRHGVARRRNLALCQQRNRFIPHGSRAEHLRQPEHPLGGAHRPDARPDLLFRRG
jgi:hypothetical protein